MKTGYYPVFLERNGLTPNFMGLWVEAPPHPAPVADLSREPVEAPPHPAPVADSSPAKLSVTSSQSGGSVDLLAGGRSESSESVWDYDERPLTQVSLKRSLEDSRQEYKDAPPTAANAPISQDLSDMPMPFQKMRRPKCPPAVRQVASEFICHKCSREINVWCPLRRQHDVFCVMCNAPYHEACMGEGAKDGSMRGPCCPKE